jgi:hypothetical protein
MPRFVILEHDHPQLHWDFMLETGSVLRTWRLAEVPIDGRPIPATAIGDHRPFYLDYEGPVSGNRGRVLRWDAGTYEELVSAENDLQVRLQGTKLNGIARLAVSEGSDWLFLFHGVADLS